MSTSQSQQRDSKVEYLHSFISAIKQCTGLLIKKISNSFLPGDQCNEATNLDELSKVAVSANWKLPPSRQPHVMVHDMGAHIDDIAQDFISRIHSEGKQSLSIGLATEMENVPGRRRPLRIVHQFQPGHCSTTEVAMSAESDDLYVSFGARPRTLLAYLNFGLRAATIGVATVLLLWIYLQASGARTSWIKDYADKHSSLIYNDTFGSDFLAKRMMNGGYTVHWGPMINSIANDKELYADYLAIIGSVRQDAQEKMQHSADLSSMAELEAVEQIASYGLDSYQKITGNWLRDNLGDQYFTWWDTGRPLFRDLRSSASISQMAANAFGIQTIKDPDGEFTWTSLEVNDIAGLRELWMVNVAENRDPIARQFDSFVEYHAPWSLFTLVRNDPRTALFNIGMPATLLVGLLGFAVWRAPRSWLRFPCRVLGWVTPEDFNSQAIARNAWIERQFSKTLSDFGVGRSQITELQGVSNAN